MASRLNARMQRLERGVPSTAPAALVDAVYDRLHRPLPGGSTVAGRLRDEFAEPPLIFPGATTQHRMLHALFAPRTTETEETGR